ncbi:MAG TPA: sigma-70 family RNA polymerase sigma factor [Polyangia bacterium]
MTSEDAQTGDVRLASLRPPDDLLAVARAAARGDGDAAATLIAEVAGGMLRVVRKVLGHKHPDVDDVAQDAVLALLGALTSFRGASSVEHFARRVALLTALRARRRARVRAREAEAQGGNGAVDDLPGNELSPLATAVASRRRALVRQLLDELPEVIAEALALHFILDHTVEEIAEAAAVPANTVWSRLRLGKQAVRRKLEADARLAEMLRGTAR